MAYDTVQKLFQSLDELERAITIAKRSLESRPETDEELLERVHYYEEMLGKQRKLAEGMCEYIKQENWVEVTRHVKLINGLSSLIHDDARELIAEVVANYDVVSEEAPSA